MKAIKKIIETKFSIYKKDGIEKTKDGSVKYKAGDYRMVGVQGEVWPLTPKAFAANNYKVISAGIAKKTESKPVNFRFADKLEYVTTAWGAKLKAKIGDAIVSAASTDQWVVDRSIFDASYKIIE